MNFQRILLFLIFSFSILMLWGEWQRQNQPAPQKAIPSTEVPAAPVKQAVQSAPVQVTQPAGGKTITVKTDNYNIEIDTIGGTLKHLELTQHRDATDLNKPITLLQKLGDHTYYAQSGLLGNKLPTHNTEFVADSSEYAMQSGQDKLEVRLTSAASKDVRVVKILTFHKKSYLIDVAYEISNTGKSSLNASAYFQLMRDATPPAGNSIFVPTYTGPAVYTDQEKFQKVDFSDIDKGKAEYPRSSDNGWIGMLQHYFVAAWLPQGKESREFYTRKLDGNLYSAGVVLPISNIEPGQKGSISVPLYIGPAQAELDEIAPGLGLTVDYGWLTVFATPLFWLMSLFNDWVNNWGIAIILLTILIKLVFFPLSAASYRSMAKMRLVAPKLEQIKKQYGDDRERLNRAMMDLYKNEKINPLGGCLPVLIQIPVFIALYWAILSSVELRHAPFFGWITDLSSVDPYFILPILMGISMYIQVKLNPVPPDPMQAKIMQIMPIAFSVVFFFMPAGLVLYSIVNNILSIAQQWHITRAEEQAKIGGSKAR